MKSKLKLEEEEKKVIEIKEYIPKTEEKRSSVFDRMQFRLNDNF